MTITKIKSELTLAVSPDFIALDFETASRDAASACAIGLAIVKDGVVIANPSLLIRPPRLYFDPDFIKIHGITAEQVKNAPEFCDIWDYLRPVLDGRIIIAHNAQFDIAVLHNTLNYYSLQRPNFHYSCTKIIAQNTWPSWKRYNLAYLAERHGFTFKHHDAAEDARVCACIALQALKKKTVAKLDELNAKLNLTFGQLHADGYLPVGSNFILPPFTDFGHWDKNIHLRAEQQKRLERATKLISETTIDYPGQTGLINGYTVTLDNCSCIDFNERKLPCKHMYHLMMKLHNGE